MGGCAPARELARLLTVELKVPDTPPAAEGTRALMPVAAACTDKRLSVRILPLTSTLLPYNIHTIAL